MDDPGSYYLSNNYGKSPIELAKGKFSIVCTGLKQVKSSLETMESSVLKGELDIVLIRGVRYFASISGDPATSEFQDSAHTHEIQE